MKGFLVKYKRAFLFSLVFSLVCFGFMLTHFTITIDEETWILANQPSLLWLLQGRFSVWLFDLVFTREGNFAPFLWDFLSVVCWHFSGVVFAYALLGKEKVKEWQMFFFTAYYASLPFVVGEILSFSMFNLQVCTAMVAVAFGFVYSIRFVEGRGKKDAGLAFLLLLYSFAIYQALICVYVTGVVAYCLLKFVKREEKGLLRFIVTCAVLCAAAAAVYYGIDMIIWHFSGTAGYLEENYIGWFSENWKAMFAASVLNVGRVSFSIPYEGEYIYGGEVIRCVTVLFVIYAVWLFFRRRGAKDKLGVFFYTAALCIAPFVMYLLLATYKTHGRMLLAIPLAGAGMDYHAKPIAFVGMVQPDELPVQKSDTLGGSIFAWDEGNVSRMKDFLRTQGYAVTAASAEMIGRAAAEAESMTSWPQEGSIREVDDMIIVKFSQPTEKWYNVNNVVTE